METYHSRALSWRTNCGRAGGQASWSCTAPPAEVGSIRTRILVCHGALDPHSPPQHVSAFMEEMNQVGADWEIDVYGGAMHGFTHETATGSTPGVKYDADADARSSERI